MTHGSCALVDAARLLDARRAGLRLETAGRSSPYADALALAAALLVGGATDVAAITRLVDAAATAADSVTPSIEARHRLDLRDLIELRRLVAAGLTDWYDAKPAEMTSLALDLLDIGEGASAGLPEAAAGARLALRHSTTPGYSLTSLIRGARSPVDDDEAEDLRMFRALPAALARSRGGRPPSRDESDVLPSGRVLPGLHPDLRPGRDTGWTGRGPRASVAGRNIMASVITSPLLLDALELTGTAAQPFLAARVRDLGSKPAAWTGGGDWPATPDGRVRVSMLRLKHGRLEALVTVGRATLVSDGDRVTITTGSAPHVIASAACGMALSAVTDIPVLTRAENEVLATDRIADSLMLTVAAPAREIRLPRPS